MARVVLSKDEKIFIKNGVFDDFRLDGRERKDYRYFEIETDVVSNTSGSARLRLSKTDILVGVKAEIGEPVFGFPDYGRIEFLVNCSANASPKFEGRGGEELSSELSRILDKAFSNKSAIDLKSLSIVSGQQCWVLYVDALVLECGGNLFDSLSIAVKAALHNTRIPNVTVNVEEGMNELEISDDPYDFSRIDIKNVPVFVTLNKIEHEFVVDACMEEEFCTDGQILVAINGDGNISGIQRLGSSAVEPELLAEMLEVAVELENH
ncbi:exosome complex component RRP42-like [Xenia sp. Carnegie-2017]|uniref:exosome complex component RRP42-like n=1 Tax=Xenia sp. Carnegie-2017 TaxID=2897299 RepID=UPI001F04FBDF|nr:exosome complex component RRP42-like [Xenia sp. Carnegie-2017]